MQLAVYLRLEGVALLLDTGVLDPAQRCFGLLTKFLFCQRRSLQKCASNLQYAVAVFKPYVLYTYDGKVGNGQN